MVFNMTVVLFEEPRSRMDILWTSGQTFAGYPGGRPGPKTLSPLLGAHENKGFCADILDVHDLRGSQKNFMQENFGMIFCS